MRTFFRIVLLSIFLVTFSAAGIHKFYVGIYQVNFVPEKKMFQITSRIFVDDLNNALEDQYHIKFTIGEPTETPEQTALLKKYLADHFLIRVNSQQKPLNFLSKELENNVLICYFTIRDIPKVSNLKITNTILFDFVTEQQNIVQTNVNKQKKSFLLTIDKSSGEIKY